MERKFLYVFIGSLFLAGCHSDREKTPEKIPPKGQIEEVSRRDSDQKPNMFDLRQDALQEQRTRGRVCPHYYHDNGCRQDNRYYQDYNRYYQDYQPYYYEES